VHDDHQHRLHLHFDRGFRELQLADIQHSDERDIRMGTFIQCAAFIDALALAYSHRLPSPGTDADKWRRFVERYFPQPAYAPVAVAYTGFRCMLLHNFSTDPTLAFTHTEPAKHLTPRLDGRVLLDRGEFVAAVTAAFEEFQREVLADAALAARVLDWLDRHPPLGFWEMPRRVLTPRDELVDVAGQSASFATTTTTTTVQALSATAGPPLDHAASAGATWNRMPDRPRADPKAAMIKTRKTKPKKQKPQG
jgi:hypothetical protein